MENNFFIISFLSNLGQNNQTTSFCLAFQRCPYFHKETRMNNANIIQKGIDFLNKYGIL